MTDLDSIFKSRDITLPIKVHLAKGMIFPVVTEQFCIPGVTSVFFSSCDSVVGDSLEFNQANRGSLRV